MVGGVDDEVLGAVLCALAGPRRGDAFAVVDAPPIALRALLAATRTGGPAGRDARLVVTGGAEAQAVAGALLLAPGGRLVSTAPDAATAARRASSCGLVLRHVEALGERVAWSAVSPAAP